MISLGHDQTRPVKDWIYSNNGDNLGISINTDGQTPLHLAAAHSQAAVVELLCKKFPLTVNRKDHKGQTALHLASSSQIMPKLNPFPVSNTRPSASSPEDNSTVEILLSHGADVNARDSQGSTCLHNASAWGNLKAVRALIQAGADPLAKNKAGWTPEYYSITVQAEVYYRNLVAEWEKRKAVEEMRASERRVNLKGGGAVRLVPKEDSDGEGESVGPPMTTGRSRESSGRSQVPGGQAQGDSESGLGISVGYVDTWK